jgi:transposase
LDKPKQQAHWRVVDVRFDQGQGRLDLQVGSQRGARCACPYCRAAEQGVHDTHERSWRQLNFFQYQAYLQAKVPQVRCSACGKTSRVAEPLLTRCHSCARHCRIEPIKQVTKAKARSYGTTRHLITIAYLIAGKLTQLPVSPFKSAVAATTAL